MHPTSPEPEPALGPGLIRRVRRLADLSQRDLADRLGVSQATVARWETGRTSPKLSVLQRVAAIGGLRIGLVDERGASVPAMRDDAARDRGSRRYPAHVDPCAYGWWTPRGSHLSVDGITARERSRQQRVPQVYYERGIWRSVLRGLGGMPDDHPTRAELVAAAEARTGETSRGSPAGAD